MIVDLFAGFLIICLLIAYFYVMSLAITFWFISIPLFILWFWWMLKREQKRQRAITPAQRVIAHAQREARRQAQARRDAMVEEALKQLRGY